MGKWIGLTEKDKQAIVDGLPGGLDGFLKGWGWSQFADAVEATLRGQNERPEPQEAEFEVIADDMNVAGACGPRAMALAEARNYALQNLDDSTTVRIEEITRTVVERFIRD